MNDSKPESKCPDPRCGKPNGHVMQLLQCDVLLTISQALNRISSYIDPSDWRARVTRGTAPPPDDDDSNGDRPVNRRSPRWYGSSIDAWNEVRKTRYSRGRLPYTVVLLTCGPLETRWAVVEYRSGKIVARFDSTERAHAECNERNLADLTG